MSDFSHLQDGDWIRLSDGSIMRVNGHLEGRLTTALQSFNYDGTVATVEALARYYDDLYILEQVSGPPASQTELNAAANAAAEAEHRCSRQQLADWMLHGQTVLRTDITRASALSGILAHTGPTLHPREAARQAIEHADELERQRNQDKAR